MRLWRTFQKPVDNLRTSVLISCIWGEGGGLVCAAVIFSGLNDNNSSNYERRY